LLAPALSWGPGDSTARNELRSVRAAEDGGIDNPGLAYNN